MRYAQRAMIRLVMTLALAFALSTAYAQDAQSISPNARAEGQLTEASPRLAYALEVTRPLTMTMTLESEDFDAYLILLDKNGEIIAEDDDSAGRLNARIVITLAESGTYTIIATSLREYSSGGELFATGRFVLTTSSEPAMSSTAIPPLPQPPDDADDADDAITEDPLMVMGDFDLRIGERSEGRLTRARAAESFTFAGEAGEVIIITLESNDFDAYLLLLDENGDEITADDDSAGNLNARIGPFELPAEGVYTIIATSFGHVMDIGGGTGAFTLSLEAVEAVELVLDTPFLGEIGQLMTSQVHTFTLDAGQAAAVVLETNSYSVYMEVSATNGDYRRVTYGGREIIGPIIAGQATTYNITVDTYDSFVSAPYSLTVQGISPVALTLNEPVTANFDMQQTLFYTFEAATNDVINIIVDSGGTVDTLFSLTTEDGFEVAFDDDSGTGFDPEVRNLFLTETGTYALLIRPFIAGDRGEITVVIEHNLVPSLDEGAQVMRISDKQAQNKVTFTGRAGERVLLAANIITKGPNVPTVNILQGETTLASNPIGQVERLLMEFTVPEDGEVQVILEDFGFGAAVIEFSLERLPATNE